MTPPKSDAILARIGQLHPKVIDLSLGRITDLLARLGNPHHSLPPVIHIAGTNGKGSTLAYLRAIYEAAGLRVHTSTSPHLVRFHERIRLAGDLIGEDALCNLLQEVETVNAGAPITFFEIAQAAAFLAYARIPADVLLLETGLGGRFDATNVIAKPALTIITPISLDHQGFLGDTIAKIAFEKAGIMKPGVPCVLAPQCLEAFDVLVRHADDIGVPLITEFAITAERDDGFSLRIGAEHHDAPLPALPGRHQLTNATVAIVGARHAGIPNHSGIDIKTAMQGITTATWPARLQKLTTGPLCDIMPATCKIILDGGHNIAAATAIADWLSRTAQGGKTLVIMGMLDNRDPVAFLKPLAPHIATLAAVPIPGEHQAHRPETLHDAAAGLGISAIACTTLTDAATQLRTIHPDATRLLILGSLYLAGTVLEHHD
ncbi:MAG: folylpolyglutamate synthase/dihydrofolate synthase family protein [Pseudomonadota bacterium]